MDVEDLAVGMQSQGLEGHLARRHRVSYHCHVWRHQGHIQVLAQGYGRMDPRQVRKKRALQAWGWHNWGWTQQGATLVKHKRDAISKNEEVESEGCEVRKGHFLAFQSRTNDKYGYYSCVVSNNSNSLKPYT